jgi:hypothetical protein
MHRQPEMCEGSPVQAAGTESGQCGAQQSSDFSNFYIEDAWWLEFHLLRRNLLLQRASIRAEAARQIICKTRWSSAPPGIDSRN